MKKIMSIILVYALFFCVVQNTYFAMESNDVSSIKNCKTIFADSNSCGAFAYGFYENSMYSSSLLPEVNNYSLKTEGKLKSACHNGRYFCTLSEIDLKKKHYRVYQLDSFNGSCKQYDFYNIVSMSPASFSVSEGRVYFVRSNSLYAYVSCYSVGGDYICDYRFSQNVNSIFNNNQHTYARLYDGSVYMLKNNSSQYCANVGKKSSISNAGSDCVSTDGGMLVFLNNGYSVGIPQYNPLLASYSNKAVRYVTDYKTLNKRNLSGDSGNSVDVNKNILLVAAYKGKSAVVTEYGECVVVDDGEFNSSSVNYDNNNNSNKNGKKYGKYQISSDGVIYGIVGTTTIARFKSKFSEASIVKNKNGDEISKGNIKTGCIVFLNGKKYSVAVMGDVTGEGNVKSNDISLLLKCRTGAVNLYNEYKMAADYNCDGNFNNKDLVLAAQKAEE